MGSFNRRPGNRAEELTTQPSRRTVLGLAATGAVLPWLPADSSANIWVFTRSAYYAGHRTVRLRRLYAPATGDRLYTIHATTPDGYRDESDRDPMWVIPVSDPRTAPPDSIRLLRLWNPRRRTHFYTTDPACRVPGHHLEPEHPAPYALRRPAEATRRIHHLDHP